MNRRPWLTTPEAATARVAARAANIAGTPRTTRPGSESTDLIVGDAVVCHREGASTGVWSVYDGRKGFIAAVNTQTFPDGSTYVELGVSWSRPTEASNPATDVWFRADELVRAWS